MGMKGIELKEIVDHSITNAQVGFSKLDKSVLDLPGYSSPMVRHLLNNLASYPGINYLEIGTHKGSTFCSALYKNLLNSAYAIDNASEFGDYRNEFLRNVKKFAPHQQFTFLDEDCFELDLKKIEHSINLYFYDGNHSFESQRSAIEYFAPVLDDVFILIVDDWNWEQVRDGTVAGMRNAEMSYLHTQYLFSEKEGDPNSWWNGLCVAVVEKCRR
jgi:hypothetical protein